MFVLLFIVRPSQRNSLVVHTLRQTCNFIVICFLWIILVIGFLVVFSQKYYWLLARHYLIKLHFRVLIESPFIVSIGSPHMASNGRKHVVMTWIHTLLSLEVHTLLSTIETPHVAINQTVPKHATHVLNGTQRRQTPFEYREHTLLRLCTHTFYQ